MYPQGTINFSHHCHHLVPWRVGDITGTKLLYMGKATNAESVHAGTSHSGNYIKVQCAQSTHTYIQCIYRILNGHWVSINLHKLPILNMQ